MGTSRKDALKRLAGLAAIVETHVAKIRSNPGHSSQQHWRAEIQNWLRQMEELVSHVGKKTSDQWQGQIAAYRSQIDLSADAED